MVRLPVIERLQQNSCTACARSKVRIGTPILPQYIDYMHEEEDATSKILCCVMSYPKKDHVETRQCIPEGSAEYMLLSEKFNNINFPVYLTDAVKCCDNKESSPKTSEIAICKNEVLQEELITLNPTVILALGYIAIRALFNVQPQQAIQYVNKKYKSELRFKDKTWSGHIYTTYHPGYLITMGNSAWYQRHEFNHIINLAIKEITNGNK